MGAKLPSGDLSCNECCVVTAPPHPTHPPTDGLSLILHREMNNLAGSDHNIFECAGHQMSPHLHFAALSPARFSTASNETPSQPEQSDGPLSENDKVNPDFTNRNPRCERLLLDVTLFSGDLNHTLYNV